MGIYITCLNDLKKYNPYEELDVTDIYFEEDFIEYLNMFRNAINEFIERNSYDKKIIDKEFESIIKMRNDEEIGRILEKYLPFINVIGDNIKNTKQEVRIVKDMILVSEKPDMKRLQKIDKLVGDRIDSYVDSFGIGEQYLDKLIDISNTNLYDYDDNIVLYKKSIEDASDYLRSVYSVNTASKKIKKLKKITDKAIDDMVINLEIVDSDKKYMDEVISKYHDIFMKKEYVDYEDFVSKIKNEFNLFKEKIKLRYSDKMAKKMISLVDNKMALLIDRVAKTEGYSSKIEEKLNSIFDNYQPENLDIFDIKLYDSEEDRDLALLRYNSMDNNEKRVFESRIYDRYIRLFKREIRGLNKEIREYASVDCANSMIRSINKRADKLIRKKAKKIGRPVPSNPWFVRKYLWADEDNFLSDVGVKIRKIINPVIRQVIKLGMKNKIIIEERAELDPTKSYVFVSTHHFTEDVIGLFSSIGRQSYMVMGTTDQIENNPLMIAAVLLGFLHVDRLDTDNRKLCFEKQNIVIDKGTSFINYVGGSWENSENELQPLSYSGPYRTAKLKNVEIVPVASYLVREDKKIYFRFGEPMNLNSYSEEEANEIIRDTLASMHFKQIDKYSKPIGSVYIEGEGFRHDLPYDQRTYYMDQIGNEYWNQPWTKPFALEEIGVRKKKITTEEEVYSFIDNLSRDKLIELANILAEPLVKIEDNDRYDIVSYLDKNYDKFKKNNCKRRVRTKNK